MDFGAPGRSVDMSLHLPSPASITSVLLLHRVGPVARRGILQKIRIWAGTRSLTSAVSLGGRANGRIPLWGTLINTLPNIPILADSALRR